MNFQKIALYGIAGLVLYDVLRRQAVAFGEKFIFAGAPQIEFKVFSREGVQTRIVLPIKNTSGVTLEIEALNLNLIYGGAILGTGDLAAPVTLQAGQTTRVPVNVFVSYAGLSGSIVELISTRLINGLFVAGSVRVFGATFPIPRTQIL